MSLRPFNFTIDPIDLDARGADEAVVDSLEQYSVVVARVPGVEAEDNAVFLDMAERYYAQSSAVLKRDVRPEIGRQVGLTEPGIEDFSVTRYFRKMPEVMALTGERAPFPHASPNRHMRFFWRYGPRPKVTNFPERHADPVIPDGFPEWEEVMNGWAGKMYPSGIRLAELTERGLRLPDGAIAGLLHEGPHLLSPTACDLSALNVGDVVADIHTDFNPFTGHGASRYRILICWTPDGRPFMVRVPPGCLFFQAGAQLEWITGGRIKAGFHQTAMTAEAVEAVRLARAEGRSTIRASSTFFFEANPDVQLQVHPKLMYSGADERYPPMLAGDHSWMVIQAIGLNSPPLLNW